MYDLYKVVKFVKGRKIKDMNSNNLDMIIKRVFVLKFFIFLSIYGLILIIF